MIDVENGDVGDTDRMRVNTKGMTGIIAESRTVTVINRSESWYAIQLPGGNTCWYKKSWVRKLLSGEPAASRQSAQARRVAGRRAALTQQATTVWLVLCSDRLMCACCFMTLACCCGGIDEGLSKTREAMNTVTRSWFDDLFDPKSKHDPVFVGAVLMSSFDFSLGHLYQSKGVLGKLLNVAQKIWLSLIFTECMLQHGLPLCILWHGIHDISAFLVVSAIS